MLFFVLFILLWLLAEGILIWLILKCQSECPRPYGSASLKAKTNRPHSPDEPQFYDAKDGGT